MKHEGTLEGEAGSLTWAGVWVPQSRGGWGWAGSLLGAVCAAGRIHSARMSL